MTNVSTTSVFDDRYKALNPAQRKAVDTIEGPVMVIAGPGTGKTSILTLRIANIIRRTDVGPGAILALTFTESGVAAMRKKLTAIVGSQAAHKVHIHTFHSFANECIALHPHAFPRIIGGSAATDIDRLEIIEGILEAHPFEKIKPFGNPQFYVKPLASAISECKREGVLPDMLASFIKKMQANFDDIPDLLHTSGKYDGKMKGKYATLQEKIKATTELAHVYAAYETALAKRHLYDFEDMINEAVRALSENEEMLMTIQEKYQYILADEHQDANASQNQLLELVSGFFDRPNLFIVGDEKQAIFRFQGASLDNFMYFKRRFPTAEIITLTDNYRSHQTILDGAHAVIAHNPAPDPMLRARLKAAGQTWEKQAGQGAADNEGRPSIHLTSLQSAEEERHFVAAEIERALGERGAEADEIAVLVRSNREAMAMARIIRTLHIPHALHVDSDFFDDHTMAQFMDIVRAVAHFGDPVPLSHLLLLPLSGVATLDAWKLHQYADRERLSLYDVIRAPLHIKAAGAGESLAAATSLYRNLSLWAKAAVEDPLIEVLERIKNECGILPKVLAEYSPADAALKLAALSVLIEEAERITMRSRRANLRDFLEHIERLAAHEIGLKVSHAAVTDGGRIHIMTAHRAKGLEFDEVYIVGANDKEWDGHGRPRYFALPTSPHDPGHIPGMEDGGANAADGGEGADAAETEDPRIADERRLFYVALTRARQTVHISYRTEKEGKPLEPSRFIGEIDPTLIYHDDTSVHAWREKDVHKKKENKMQGAPMGAHAGADAKDEAAIGNAPLLPTPAMRAFVQGTLAERGLSISAINNFITCPWRFFFQNLIRLPQVKEPHQLYGTAMHAALEYMYSTMHAYWQKERDEPPLPADIIAQFEHALAKAPLGNERYEAALIKGKAALEAYIRARMHTLNALPSRERPTFRTEMRLNAELNVPDLGIVPSNGVIDRLDTYTDGAVQVTDYKTGKRHTRGDILGTTKTSDGNIWRQAVFYRMLIGLHDEHAAVPREVIIEFVEHYEAKETTKTKVPTELLAVSDDDVRKLHAELIPLIQNIANLSFWNTPCKDAACEHCMLAKRVGWIR